MIVHQLKTWPASFEAVRVGRKKHELRVNDRNFQVGDVLDLREWDPDRPSRVPPGEFHGTPMGRYTHRRVRATVTYVTAGGQWGLPADLCVMSIELVDGSYEEPTGGGAA